MREGKKKRRGFIKQCLLLLLLSIRGRGWMKWSFVSLFFFHSSILDTLLLLLAAAAAASNWLVNQSFLSFFLFSFMLFFIFIFGFVGWCLFGFVMVCLFCKDRRRNAKKKKKLILFYCFLFIYLFFRIVWFWRKRHKVWIFLLCCWIWTHEKGNLFVEERTVAARNGVVSGRSCCRFRCLCFAVLCFIFFGLGVKWCQFTFRFDRFSWKMGIKDCRYYGGIF